MPDYLSEYESYRRLLDGALGQIGDDEFFRSVGGANNSAAVIIRHLAGNLASRFTDFLTSDGEKPWRQRDREFDEDRPGNRAAVMSSFEESWRIVFGAVAALEPADMTREVTIRGKPLKVEDALLRSVAHFAQHVGQIILIGKFFRGDDWRWLSIPPGGSESYNQQPDRR